MMFIRSKGLVLVSCLISQLALGFSAAAAAEAPCYFSCKEVPPANRVLYHVGKPSDSALPSGEIRMLIWNVYKGAKPEFLNVFDLLVGAIRPQVVVMEEVTLDRKVLPAMERLPKFGWDLSANFLMAGGIPTGPAVGSAARPRTVSFERTTDREPFVESPKTSVIVQYPIQGSKQTLLVAAIHGINFTGDAPFAKQLNEIADRHFAHHNGPIIFAGDFNIRNSNRAQIAAGVSARYGLERAPWKGATSIYYQLDDAYTRGVKILNAEVWSEDVEHIGSDHPALFLKFELPR